jgi:PEP-CTERM motif
MKYANVTVFSLVLIMPGLAFGMGFNPFKHSSDHPGAPPSNNAVSASQGTNSVPEPATALTVGLGILGLAAWRRYRQP